MSIKIMNQVWESQLPEGIPKNKRSTVKIVLLKLADNANDHGKCWPSMDRIAHEAELSRRSVIRAISDLEGAGLIKVRTHREGGVKHNTYFINTPMLDSLCNPYQKQKEENDNPFTNPSDTLSNPSDTLSKIGDRVALKPSRTIIESSKNTEHFSKEKRIDVNSLEGYEYCKEAYRFLNLCKPKAENLYTGPLTIEQWNQCEEKLSEVLSEPEEVDTLIFNIHRERKMHNLKSVSLPYILMAFTDCEEFAHIAMNRTEWLEE